MRASEICLFFSGDAQWFWKGQNQIGVPASDDDLDTAMGLVFSATTTFYGTPLKISSRTNSWTDSGTFSGIPNRSNFPWDSRDQKQCISWKPFYVCWSLYTWRSLHLRVLVCGFFSSYGSYFIIYLMISKTKTFLKPHKNVKTI